MQSQRRWENPVSRLLCTHRKGLKAPDAAAQLAIELRAQISNPTGPADLQRACAAVNTRVEYKSLRNDAILQETEAGFLAIINSSATKGRQRFSLAHEIGHLRLFETTRLTRAFAHKSESAKEHTSDEVEELCDHFASELLMPLEEWRREIFRRGISIGSLKVLSSKYNVSLPAAAKRAIDTGIWRCAFVLWDVVNDGDKLVELKPNQFWSNIEFGPARWPNKILNDPRFREAGSPLLAAEQTEATIGEIKVPFDGLKERYLAESRAVWGRSPQVATVILAERQGRRILLMSQGDSKK
jgi:Zn-dependent peptidase ImmA (M78 family)